MTKTHSLNNRQTYRTATADLDRYDADRVRDYVFGWLLSAADPDELAAALTYARTDVLRRYDA